MATFSENMTVIAEKLTGINSSLQTIAGAIGEGKLTIDPDLIAAVQDLKFNGQEIDFGTFRLRFDGKTASINL
jgi:hypothetical protein